MIPENILIDEAKNELNKIKKIEKKNIDRENSVYRENEYTYSFQTIKTFGRDIYESKINVKEID